MQALEKLIVGAVLAIALDIMAWALWDAYFPEKATELGGIYPTAALIAIIGVCLAPWIAMGIAVAKSLKG